MRSGPALEAGRLRITIASASEPGRRGANEDRVLVGSATGRAYAVLADGAGGHRHGAEAAQRSVAAVEAALRGSRSYAAEALGAAIASAHVDLQRRQPAADDRARMHTTIVVLWVDPAHERALWGHVGDSRLHRLRHGSIERLTVDDSVVQRMLDAGLLTPDQAAAHPMKNRLLAALGMPGTIDPHVAGDPSELLDGDAYLLSSDGWWSAIGEPEIAALLRDADTPDAWIDAMRERIDARAPDDQDNYSAIAVWISDPAEDTQTGGFETD